MTSFSVKQQIIDEFLVPWVLTDENLHQAGSSGKI